MKAILGIILIIGGLALGLYVGVWWAFIGGIVSIIQAIQTPPVQAMTVALGILRILCASLLGTAAGGVFVFSGAALVSKS